METLISLLAALPFSYGGLALAKKPQLNFQIQTKRNGSEKVRYGDITFPDERMILEYNGSYHEGERANEDDQRRNELIAQGYTIITLNFQQVIQPALLSETLEPVVKRIGTVGRRPSDYAERRKSLLSILFEINDTDCELNKRNLIPDALKPVGSAKSEVNAADKSTSKTS